MRVHVPKWKDKVRDFELKTALDNRMITMENCQLGVAIPMVNFDAAVTPWAPAQLTGCLCQLT